MSVLRESDIEFDFTKALKARKHDADSDDFPGVDFIVAEASKDIWVEVKNWEQSSIPLKFRDQHQQDFAEKINDKAYFRETLRGKFLGTIAFLCLNEAPPTRAILYVALLEASGMDSAIMSRATDRLTGLVNRKEPWKIPVTAVVINLAEWNRRFPEYPATAL